MTGQTAGTVADAGPLGIICGGGSLPFAVAEAVQRRGRRVVLFALRGSADPQRVAAFPHHWGTPGQLRRNFDLFRAEGCRDLVFIGSIVRPKVAQIRFDLFTLRMLPRIIRMFRQGDDRLLTEIGRIFEEHGFRMLGAHEVAPEILMPQGLLGQIGARQDDLADISRGFALLQATSDFDIGQAVVVSDNRVLAIEAAEGTDQMLMRLAELRRSGRIQARDGVGVLVKSPKSGQDRRFDLPSIGPLTVEACARAGLAGIAVLAGGTVVAEPDRIAAAADRLGLFVIGMPPDGSVQ